MDSLTTVYHFFGNLFAIEPEITRKSIATLVLLVFAWLVRYLGNTIITRRSSTLRQAYQYRKAFGYTVLLILVLLLGRTWFQGFSSFTTFLGIFSAGLAVALREPIASLAGWAYIVSKQPFNVGDRIEVQETKGDVIDIGIFKFTILEIGNWINADHSTGRTIQIPNMVVYQKPIANYTQGFQYIWNEIPILITFESNWKKAQAALQDILDKRKDLSSHIEREIHEASQYFFIHYSKFTPIVYNSIEDSGVLLTMRYLCHPRQKRDSEHEIYSEVLSMVDAHDDIELAYTTRRMVGSMFSETPHDKSEGDIL